MKKYFHFILTVIIAAAMSYGCAGGGGGNGVAKPEPLFSCPTGGLPPELSANLKVSGVADSGLRLLREGTILPMMDGAEYQIVISANVVGADPESLKITLPDTATLFPSGGGELLLDDSKAGETVVTVKVNSDPKWENFAKDLVVKVDDCCGTKEFKLALTYRPDYDYIQIIPDRPDNPTALPTRLTVPIRRISNDTIPLTRPRAPVSPSKPTRPSRPVAPPSFDLITENLEEADSTMRITGPVRLDVMMLSSATVRVTSTAVPLISFERTIGDSEPVSILGEGTVLSQDDSIDFETTEPELTITYTAQNSAGMASASITFFISEVKSTSGSTIAEATELMTILGISELPPLPSVADADGDEGPKIYVVGKYRASDGGFEAHGPEELAYIASATTFNRTVYNRLLVYVVDPDGDEIESAKYYGLTTSGTNDYVVDIDMATDSVSVGPGQKLFPLDLLACSGENDYELAVFVNTHLPREFWTDRYGIGNATIIQIPVRLRAPAIPMRPTRPPCDGRPGTTCSPGVLPTRPTAPSLPIRPISPISPLPIRPTP